jgi:hypothetical protein
LRQHVGNWPGKTVEKAEGICLPSRRTARPHRGFARHLRPAC